MPHPERLTSGTAPPEPSPGLRVRARTLFYLVVVFLLAIFLLSGASGFALVKRALGEASWGWVVGAGIFSASTFVTAALVTMHAVDRRLSWGRTIMVQLGSTFANRLGPQGVGSYLVIERYYERAGASRAASIAGLGILGVVSTVVWILGVVISFVFLGASSVAGSHAKPLVGVQLPGRLLLVLLAGLALGGLAALLWRDWARRLARRALVGAQQSAAAFFAVLRRPRQTAWLLVHQVGVVLAYILCLALSVRAVGVHTGLSTVAIVSLVGGSLGAAVPAPGGIGTVDVALVGAFTLFGVESAPATAGVLVYRLLTFWLPTLPGFFAFHWLEKRGYI